MKPKKSSITIDDWIESVRVESTPPEGAITINELAVRLGMPRKIVRNRVSRDVASGKLTYVGTYIYDKRLQAFYRLAT